MIHYRFSTRDFILGSYVLWGTSLAVGARTSHITITMREQGAGSSATQYCTANSPPGAPLNVPLNEAFREIDLSLINFSNIAQTVSFSLDSGRVFLGWSEDGARPHPPNFVDVTTLPPGTAVFNLNPRESKTINAALIFECNLTAVSAPSWFSPLNIGKCVVRLDAFNSGIRGSTVFLIDSIRPSAPALCVDTVYGLNLTLSVAEDKGAISASVESSPPSVYRNGGYYWSGTSITKDFNGGRPF